MSAASHVHAQCSALARAELTYPFGPQASVYKVDGKVFAVLGTNGLTVKCTPEHAEVLVGEHEHIVPGYHMNKRHWITVDLDGTVPAGLVEDLVDDSYHLVESKRRR